MVGDRQNRIRISGSNRYSSCRGIRVDVSVPYEFQVLARSRLIELLACGPLLIWVKIWLSVSVFVANGAPSGRREWISIGDDVSGEFVSELLEALEAATAGIFAFLYDFFSLCLNFRNAGRRTVKFQ